MILDEIAARISDIVALPELSASQTLDRLKRGTNAPLEQILAAAIEVVRTQARLVVELENEIEDICGYRDRLLAELQQGAPGGAAPVNRP